MSPRRCLGSWESPNACFWLKIRTGKRDGISPSVAIHPSAVSSSIGAIEPGSGLRRLPVEGGWYAMIEAPRALDEDAWVERLIEDHAVVVHPGYFFDAEGEGIYVVSLLPEAGLFAAAIGRVVGALAGG